MNAASVHDARAVGDALGTVVVAADDEHLGTMFEACEFVEKIIEKAHGFTRWGRTVEDVACDKDAVGCILTNDVENLLQDMPLVVKHGGVEDEFADMEV